MARNVLRHFQRVRPLLLRIQNVEQTEMRPLQERRLFRAFQDGGKCVAGAVIFIAPESDFAAPTLLFRAALRRRNRRDEFGGLRVVVRVIMRNRRRQRYLAGDVGGFAAGCACLQGFFVIFRRLARLPRDDVAVPNHHGRPLRVGAGRIRLQ